MADPQIDLPPEADAFVNRVRKVEGTAGGAGYVKYGNTPFTPEKDFPKWEGVDLGGGKKTHAAGPGQWQPGTWDEVKTKFKGYGVDLDFSNEQHQKAAIWDKGYQDYKKFTGKDLREDIKNNSVQWDKLAPTWQGFTPRVTQTEKPGGKIDPQAIAYEQSRPHQSVWYFDPQELLGMLPEQSAGEGKTKRKSLMKSLGLGDDIYDLPQIEVSDKGDTRKITGFDGRNRLQAMIDAGLTAVPVAVKGLEPEIRPQAIEGMTGKTMPIRFDPVPMVPRESLPPLPIRRAADPYGAAKEVARHLINAPSETATAITRAGQQQPPERVFQNEAGQPFTMSGAPVPQPPPQPQPQRLPGEIPYAGRISDIIRSTVQGAAMGGQRAMGIGGGDPLRPLEPEILGAAASLGGLPGAPGAGRFGPATADANFTPAAPAPAAPMAAEGRNMLAQAELARGQEFPKEPTISPERASLALEARDVYGLPLTRVEVGMTKPQQLRASAVRGLPGSGDAARQKELHQAFNRAVSKTIGEDSPTVTSEVWEKARERIGDGLEDIETNAPKMPLKGKFGNRIGRIYSQARRDLDANQLGVIERNLKHILTDSQGQNRTSITGKVFGNLMHRGSSLDKAVNHGDPAISSVAGEIKQAMQELLADHLPQPQQSEYQNLRFQWKNLKTIEPLVAKAPTGDISPALLNTQAVKSFGTSSQAPLRQLGKIGQAFLKEPPTSTTPERGTSLLALGKLGGLIGGAAVGHFAGVPLMEEAIALGATLGTGRIVTNMLAAPKPLDRMVQNALSRLPPSPQAKRNAIAEMMSARGANTLTPPP